MTFHPITAADRTVMAAMRTLLEPIKDQLLSGPEKRATYDELKERTPVGPRRYLRSRHRGRRGRLVVPPGPAAPGSAGLFLHGGAYVLGSALAFRNSVGQLAAAAGLDFFVPEYRLAPEHPFPAAFDDALAAYRGLVALGKQHLAVAGDLAGGDLALALSALLTQEAARPPGAVPPQAPVVFSPWTDLALTSASMQTRSDADFVLTREALAPNADRYLRGHDAHDPLASPVYGPLAGLPPVQLHTGDAEVLLDDSVRYADGVRATSGSADLHVWEGMTHVFVNNVTGLEAARQAIAMSGEFLRERVG